MGKILAITNDAQNDFKHDYLEKYFREQGYRVSFISLSESLLTTLKDFLNISSLVQEYDALIIPDEYPFESQTYCNRLTKAFVESGGLVLPISNSVNVLSLLHK